MGRQYAAGIPIGTAIENAAESCGNLAIANATKIASLQVRAGERVDVALIRQMEFPDYARQLLITAQETGEFKILAEKASWIAGADTLHDEPLPFQLPLAGPPLPFLHQMFIRGTVLIVAIPLFVGVNLWGLYSSGMFRPDTLEKVRRVFSSPIAGHFAPLIVCLSLLSCGIPLIAVGIFAVNIGMAVTRKRRGEPL